MHYYTIHCEGAPESEAQDFLSRMERITDYGDGDDVDYTHEIDVFIALLGEIGERRGAKSPRLFRAEGAALALPPGRSYLATLGLEPMQIRLYCYKVSERIVILFNGDIKTPGAQSAQSCPRVGPYFAQAQRFAKALDEARRENYWWPVHFNIETDDDKPLELEVTL